MKFHQAKQKQQQSTLYIYNITIHGHLHMYFFHYVYMTKSLFVTDYLQVTESLGWFYLGLRAKERMLLQLN